jgi:hypothetical protein
MSKIRSANVAGPDQFADAIVETLGCLVPSSKVRAYGASLASLVSCIGRKPYLYGRSESGFFIRGATALFWFRGSGERYCCIEATRQSIPISRFEKSVLKHLPRTIESLHTGGMEHGPATGARIASQYSFSNLLITRCVRRTVTSTNLWGPALVLTVLSDLAVMRYEGHPTVSGFLFAKEYSDYAASLDTSLYEIYPFEHPIPLTRSIFSEPASYRYINGRNAFYVVDRNQLIHGTVHCNDPSRFNRLQRATHQHLQALLSTNRTRAWVAYVGDNDDVNVVQPNLTHLRLSKRRWRILDFDLLSSLLISHGVEDTTCDHIMAAIRAISDMRMGTSILIPNDPNLRPQCIANIDASELGESLRAGISSRSVDDLLSRKALIGMLTSDGMTSISKTGTVLGTGEIVNLSKASESQVSGGGRTQACVAASRFGLVLKVSEDGPITAYQNGDELLRLFT